jgi:PAB-dependent poly(A)-specific ribonuclease subunit 3
MIELENGRLMRLMVKLGMITERRDQDTDPSWAETGDRYLLKLFRDWVFHRTTETGAPETNWGFIVEALNKVSRASTERTRTQQVTTLYASEDVASSLSPLRMT